MIRCGLTQGPCRQCTYPLFTQSHRDFPAEPMKRQRDNKNHQRQESDWMEIRFEG